MEVRKTIQFFTNGYGNEKLIFFWILPNREKRLAIKSELQIRKRAMVDEEFPSQKIIDEFLNRPVTLPKLDLNWKQPSVVKFLVRLHLVTRPCITRYNCYTITEIHESSAAMGRNLLLPEIPTTANQMATISLW